jgi:chemotaxis response regulator CheB
MIAILVHAALADAGFKVSVLSECQPEAIRTAVERLDPECVLLDGETPYDYGASWTAATWLQGQGIPVIMFSSNPDATAEARAGMSERSQAAAFAAILEKPFDLDELVDLVAQLIGIPVHYQTSAGLDAHRAARLRSKLQSAGRGRFIYPLAVNGRTSRPRTPPWSSCTGWERDSIYYVMRHAISGGHIEQVGQFHTLDAAIELAMLVRQPAE